MSKVGGTISTERPQDRADVAQYYGAVPPPSLWNPVARQIAAAEGRSLSDIARAFALINMAMADAAVATFDTKYHYNFWRPETAIRMGDTDGNSKTDPDGSFRPFLPTPCFPGYPSAHATLSNAARDVLDRIYGGAPQTITLSTPAVPGVTLRYSKPKQITADVDDARVFGGMHFRFDQEAGADRDDGLVNTSTSTISGAPAAVAAKSREGLGAFQVEVHETNRKLRPRKHRAARLPE